MGINFYPRHLAIKVKKDSWQGLSGYVYVYLRGGNCYKVAE